MKCSIRTQIFVLILGMSIPRLHAADFTRSTVFDSVQQFISATGAFRPASAHSDLSALFTVREEGQPDDPKTGKPVAAPAIKSCDSLWQDDTHALVFAYAMPPLEATNCRVGVLFFLEYTHGHWSIKDNLRFIATGRDAAVSADLTVGTGSGYKLGDQNMEPVVTVTESQGGGGYSYQSSASYTITASGLRVLKLK